MKKLTCFALALLLFLCLGFSGAWGYDILNNTTIQDTTGSWIGNGLPWNGNTNPIDVPGDGNFSTKGADWNAATHTLTLYSNWGTGRDGFDGIFYTADLLIGTTGTPGVWNFSIGLDDGTNGAPNRIGKVYTGADQGTVQPGGYTCGLNYNNANPLPIVIYKPDYVNGGVPVTWTLLGNTANPDYKVEVILGNLVGDQFDFLWGSGTCGNGTMAGHVPLPPTVLLLGSGLLGLVGLRYRRKA
jgi:hypothetical protein